MDPASIAAALVTVIVALTGATIAVLTAISKMKSELLIKSAELAVRTEQVHVLVNGRATASTEKLEALERKLELVHAELRQSQEARIVEAKGR